MKHRSYYLRRYTLVATLLWLSLLVTGVFYTQAQSTSIKINFQDGGDAPTGYEADNGDAYGVRSNGETYGWRNADTDAPIDASGNARKRGSGSITLTNTLMHLRYNECCSGNGLNVPVYWEIALPNGTYNVTVSVGDSSNDTQPTVHILTAEGVVITDGSAGKTPAEYPTQQVTVTDGALTLDQGTGGFNTKINYVEIDFVDAAPPLALFDVMVNFQASQEAPDGYLADYGDAYGTRSNGETYGWRSVNTGAPFDASANARNRDGNANITLANTLMHLRYNECCSNGSNGTQEPVYWEIEVPNGTYNVLVSLGDANPENTGATAHSITAEDIVLGGAEVAPTEYLAQPITVTDGALTIDQAPNGFNTKINYIEISSTGVALTPAITSTDPLNGATNVSLTTAISANVFLPTDGQGVDPATLTDPNAPGHPSATDTVRLIEMSNGQEGPQVPLNSVNTSGGNDVIVATPAQNLKPLTTYKFVVDGVQDLAGATFDFYEGTFTTGLDNSGGGGSTKVKFTSTEVVPNGAHTSLAIGPDGRFYATTIMGVLRIWDINQDGTLTNLREFDPSPITGRAVIGLEFDPTSTPGNPIIWVTHSEGGNTIRGGGGKHFTSSIAILTVENHDTASENWTGRDVIVGLPRSHKDHLSNSLELGPDGALYMTQGSISGMGDQDSGWGNEPETLLSAAVLRIDRAAILSASANDLPIDVATGIPNSNGDLYTGGGTGETDPNLMLPNFGLNDPGLAANGLYDPLAPNAPVTIFATGLRNAYDLLWHSNGHLYSATNGSATGSARTPATPANVNDLPQCQSRINGEPYPNDIPAVETLFRPPTQPDLFFRVVEGVYYGHPNPTRCEWVLNGGDPAGDIVARVSQYADGTNPDPNYAPFNGGDIYNLGNNWSPNGTIEYTSNTFGGALRGTVMVVRYSGGDDILVMNVDSNGDFVRNNERSLEDENGNVLRFESPLDLVEDTTNGNIYVSAYSGTRIYLLRPFGSQVTPEGEILLSDGPIIFEEGLNESGTYDPVANPRNVTITNNGNGTLNLTSIELSGANADKYELPNSLPTEVAPNSSVDVAVTFNPTEEGVAVASFDVVSDDPFTPNASVELRGLGKDGFDGSDEPSLQLILDTFGFGIDVGDDFPLTTPLHSSLNSGNTDTVFGNQEVEAPSFVKAGDGDVTIEVIAAYGPRNGSYEIGWYTAGNPDSKQLLQDLSANPNTNMNRLLPALNGSNSFDPGTTRFGFFNHWTTFDKPNSPYYIYTEEDLNTNTNEGTPIDNYVRTYPMPGEVNTYVVAIEEVPRGFDYQDFVFIVRNVVPVVPGDGQLAVSPDRLIFDNVSSSSNEDEGASAEQTITISNPGSGVLSLTDISLTGSGAGEFEFAGNLPGFVLPGESETISVVFDPASVGLFTASVGITSDAASNGIVSVELRGLGKKGFGGGDEPSLQQVLDTYDIPVNVGDDDPSTNVIHSQSAQQSAALLGDEVEIQLFLPIGNGEVEIELLSVYGPNDNPVTMVGWYDGFTKAETELLRVSNGSHQTLNPVFTGSTSFAPVGPFGFYSQWPFFNDRKLYSEDTLNTFNGAIPHHVRVYELPGEANAYVVATEEHISGFDFQDVVFIVRNVEPAGASGEINLVNLDWDKPGTNNDLMGQNIPELDYLNRWLTMSSLNNNVNQHEVKDTARLLIENTSQTEPLVITALTISDTSEFDFYAEGNIQPPTLPLTIEPGDTYDLWIEFVHQGNNGTKGILYQETLTIVSTAEYEPVIEVVLAGGWQGGPEGGREIDSDEVAGAFGFVTDSQGRTIQPLSSEYLAKN
ncbi:MAG: choice-of-anchor D domain-containing protein, partial [Chloroflexota bacterium]